MPRPPKGAQIAAVSEPRSKGQYVLEERQIRALREEAVRRAAERHAGRLDASEVLREVIDAWIARNSGGKR